MIARSETLGTRRAMQRSDSSRAGDVLQGRRIAFLGSGCVGLPAAVSFVYEGAEDTSRGLSRGDTSTQMSLIAPNRASLTPKPMRALRKQVSQLTSDASALADADVVRVSVPTPGDKFVGALQACGGTPMSSQRFERWQTGRTATADWRASRLTHEAHRDGLVDHQSNPQHTSRDGFGGDCSCATTLFTFSGRWGK